jgi:hypothetical protein
VIVLGASGVPMQRGGALALCRRRSFLDEARFAN